MNQEHRYPNPDWNQYRLDEYELANNPETRMPIVICIDCSFSMRQEGRLDRVMEGLQTFCREMSYDPIAKEVAELCIVCYGGDFARVACDFTPIDRLILPRLFAQGATPLTDAVHLSLEMINARKLRYQDNGVSYYHPWIIFLGDGDDSDNSRALDDAAALIKQEHDSKHVHILCVAVGDADKMEYASLMKLSPEGQVQFLRDMKFTDFFAWLSKSVQKVSQSVSGEEINFPTTSSWGEMLVRK